MRHLIWLALLVPTLAAAQGPFGSAPFILSTGGGFDPTERVPDNLCPLIFNGRCFDGGEVLTNRSTPVPCGSGTAGVDVGCYQGALHVSDQVTTHWPNSTRPDLWPQRASVTVTGNVINDESASASGTVRPAHIQMTAGEVWTVSCELSAGTQAKARIWAGAGGSCQINLTSTPDRYSCTGTVTTTGLGSPSLVVGHVDADVGTIHAHQCQWVRSPTRGRRCDAGAAPTTCDSDKSRRSAEGWPTIQGEISIRFRLLEAPVEMAYIIDGRSPEVTSGVHALVMPDLSLRAGSTSSSGGTAQVRTGLVVGRWYVLRLVARPDGVSVYLDGELRTTLPQPMAWAPTVTLGGRHTSVQFLNGTISRLEWSNQ